MRALNRLACLAIAAMTVCAAGAAFTACGGDSGADAGTEDGGDDSTMSHDATPARDGTVDVGGDGTANDGTANDSTLGDGPGGDGQGDGATSSDGGDDGGDAGSTADAGFDAALSPDGFSGDGGCLMLGSGCSTSADCCFGACSGGVCSYPSCLPDTTACTSSGQCCSQVCNGNNVCRSLGSACTTLGNPCANNSDCCSNRCVGGVSGGTCQPSAWCGQAGDICAQNIDCCTGTCNLLSGQSVGTCALTPPGGAANCGFVDGMLCAGTTLTADGGIVYTDGGKPTCGGACCSRSCGPWGPTGVLVCQPASGCHVVGDLCGKDSDCCGSLGMAGPPPQSGHYVTCSATDGGVGICGNPQSCKPNGDVCKLATMSCNSSCNCCAGNCENQAADGGYTNVCRQDNVGVPRCASPGCSDAGGGCASSADCCNGDPCVPNPVDGGTPPYVCYPSLCVPSCGTCSNNADCCPGYACNGGTCDPCGGGGADGGTLGDGGTSGDGGVSGDAATDGPCSLYGQLCMTSNDCCNTVPCTDGRCIAP